MFRDRYLLVIVCSVIFLVSFASTVFSGVFTNQTDGLWQIDGGAITYHVQGAPATLSGAGDYDWWYGCSPTSAGMLMGYYDVHGYNGQSYANLVPGTVAEDDTFGTPSAQVNGIIASHGHQYDFYGNVDGSTDRSTFQYDTDGGYGDGFLNSNEDIAQAQWHNFDCLADFMGTSQDAHGHVNGATGFWYYSDGAPLYEIDIEGAGADYYESSGMYGVGEYLEYTGYDAGVLYNQYLDTEGWAYGFTYAEYMAEIDAGRGLLLHMEGHTVYGYGYDPDTSSVLFRDTWSPGAHSATWGGEYDGRTLYGVTVLEVTVPEPMTILMLGFGAVMVKKRRLKR